MTKGHLSNDKAVYFLDYFEASPSLFTKTLIKIFTITYVANSPTVYSIKYAYGFVVGCFVFVEVTSFPKIQNHNKAQP